MYATDPAGSVGPGLVVKGTGLETAEGDLASVPTAAVVTTVECPTGNQF